MKFPKIEVAYTIVFNNTGLDWADIQNAVCQIIECKYGVLHCIGNEYHEKRGAGANYIEIKEVPCLLYFRVYDLKIEVIAIKSEFLDKENREWNCYRPDKNGRELYIVTVNRKSDNHTWVQDMIWDGYAERWLWSDDPEDHIVDENRFKIVAWRNEPSPYQYVE